MQFYAKDIMADRVITVRPDLSCQEAAQLFTVNKITGAPVVNEHGVLIGVISVYDLLEAGTQLPSGFDYFSQAMLDERLGETGFHIEPVEGMVDEYMTREVYTAFPSTPIEDLAKTMYLHRIHRIIIVSPQERQVPVGIVTTFDLLKILAEGYSTEEFVASPEPLKKAKAKS